MRKKEQKGHLIIGVEPGSIAEELEIEAGDRLLKINQNEIEDIFDYRYYVDDTYLEMTIRKANGEEWELDIEKELQEDIGLIFENGLMSEYRSCRNQCIFCFIDQMPPGMRETLYFKDDDSRLSFLQGNYVTLTNMSDKDLDRIIRFHLAPINISVHTTDPELRKKMLHNRFAGNLLERIQKLYDAGIEMNGQIVLCPGINDAAQLDRSIEDLSRFLPYMRSLSVVPVGVTKYRDGLYPLETFDQAGAERTVAQIEAWQKKFLAEHGCRFVQASDEFYILAKRQIPPAEQYEGYIQLENGVGMVRLLLDECREALEELEGDDRKKEISLATGKLAYGYLKEIIGWIQSKFPNIKVHLYAIRNDFFGETITVAGLVTGGDLIHQLKGQPLGTRLLLPSVMLRSGEDVFLDDVTTGQVETALQVPVHIVKSSGCDFIHSIVDEDSGQEFSGRAETYPPYEI
jgi:putative radical SAM enzyme (TIGR03279 family)